MTDSAHTDPLAFDYAIGFKSSAERIKGERERRLDMAAREIPYHVPFLNDCLRSIMPHDLIVVGARTGVGKTELVRSIASSNAAAGRRSHYFALEAEADELERRTKYGVLAQLVFEHRVLPKGTFFNYPDWYRGKFDRQLGRLEDEADRVIAERYKTLHTYYRGPKFDSDDIHRLLLACQDQTDLFVLDHLHYIDSDDDNENRGVKEIVMTIRNSSLLVGKPVILVVHLRKRAQNSKALVPHTEEIHGSSDVGKVATHTIMLERAFDVPTTNRFCTNTFFAVTKDRGDGANGLIAVCSFDRRTKSYAPKYTLGRDVKGSFEPLGTSEVPYWAENHEPLSVPYELGDDA